MRTAEEKKEYQKLYRENNKQKIKDLKKRYRELNKKEINEYQKSYYYSDKAKEYRKTNEIKTKERFSDWVNKNGKLKSDIDKKYYEENKVKILEKNKKYRQKTKEKRNKQIKSRALDDQLFRLKRKTRSVVSKSFRDNGFTKKLHTHEILKCSFEELKKHIESKWEPWMNWNNYGSINGKSPTELNQCWDIDHIIPLSTAKTEDELIKLNNYTNLQPLCSYTNRWIKSNK